MYAFQQRKKCLIHFRFLVGNPFCLFMPLFYFFLSLFKKNYATKINAKKWEIIFRSFVDASGKNTLKWVCFSQVWQIVVVSKWLAASCILAALLTENSTPSMNARMDARRGRVRGGGQSDARKTRNFQFLLETKTKITEKRWRGGGGKKHSFGINENLLSIQASMKEALDWVSNASL